MKKVRYSWTLGAVPAAAALAVGTQPAIAAPEHATTGKKSVAVTAIMKTGCTGLTFDKVNGHAIGDYLELWYTRLASTAHKTCIGTVKAKEDYLKSYFSPLPLPHYVEKTWRIRIWEVGGILLDHFSSTTSPSTRSHGFHKSYATSNINIFVCSAYRSNAQQPWATGYCINSIP